MLRAPELSSLMVPVLSAQKNPQAIRLAEERRGLEQLTMSVAVNLSRAWQLSSHIHNVCSEAREAIYTGEAEVKHWLDKGQWSLKLPQVLDWKLPLFFSSA